MLKRLFNQLLNLNKYPILYHGRDFYLAGFGFFAAIATLLGLIIFTWYSYLKGVVFTIHFSIWSMVVIFLMIFFSKFIHPFVVGRKFLESPMKYLRQTAFYNQGGQIGVLLSMVTISYFEGINFLLLLDGVCYAFAFALIFGRLGCYNYGCCYGKLTKSSFAVRYTNPETKVLRFHPELKNKKLIPIQLISVFFNLILFSSLTLLLFYETKSGLIAFTFIVAYNVFRMIIHPLRLDDYNDSKPSPLYFYIALSFVCFGLIGFIYLAFFYSNINIVHIKNSFDIVSYFKNYLDVYTIITFSCITLAVFFIYGYHKKLGRHF